MKLITPEFEALFKDYPLDSQKHVEDPLVIAKLFDPCTSATWYLTEYDPVEKRALSFVIGTDKDNWGYVYFDDIEYFERLNKFSLEMDLHFKQKRLSKFIKK